MIPRDITQQIAIRHKQLIRQLDPFEVVAGIGIRVAEGVGCTGTVDGQVARAGDRRTAASAAVTATIGPGRRRDDGAGGAARPEGAERDDRAVALTRPRGGELGDIPRRPLPFGSDATPLQKAPKSPHRAGKGRPAHSIYARARKAAVNWRPFSYPPTGFR